MRFSVQVLIITGIMVAVFQFNRRISNSAPAYAASPTVKDVPEASQLPPAMTGKITDLRQLSGNYGFVLSGLTNHSFYLVSPFDTRPGKQIPVSSFGTSNLVSSVLAAHGFPREKLNRFQVRVFKQDQIIQGPRIIERDDPEGVGRELFQTRLSEGDIIAIIPTRE